MHWQGHSCSKTLHQQNPPVLNWRFRLQQVDLYTGHKTVVVVVVIVCVGCVVSVLVCWDQFL